MKTFHQHDYRSEPSATDNAEVTDVTTVSRRGFKNHTNLDPEGSKIKENRRLEGSWALLVRFLGSLVRFGGNFSRSWGEDGRKMIEVGARMASSRVLDGP